MARVNGGIATHPDLAFNGDGGAKKIKKKQRKTKRFEESYLSLHSSNES